MIGTLAEIAKKHMSVVEHVDRRGIAMGFPGPFDYQSGVCLMKGLEKFDSLYGINVGEYLTRSLPEVRLPLRFGPDAEMAILGEARYGYFRRYARLIGITIGTGLGSGYVVGGSIVREGKQFPRNGQLYCEP